MSIEQYFLHIANYAYVDVDYYENEEINRDILKSLGVTEDISIGDY